MTSPRLLALFGTTAISLLAVSGCSSESTSGDGAALNEGDGSAGTAGEANDAATSAGGKTGAGGAATGGTAAHSGAGGASGGSSTGGTAGGSSSGGAAGSGTGGVTSLPDLCDQPSDCPGGTCWQRLDGVKDCITPKPAPTLGSCQFAPAPCCTGDGDCTDSASGRCLPLFDVAENFCGGAYPDGNVCRYDRCASDADCKAQAPAGATVAVCLPSGALGTWFATCAYGGCRTDADCTESPGGTCQYGLAATHGACSLIDVLFCAYPADPCGGPGQVCSSGMVCAPKDDYQGRECGEGPPMYP